MRYQIVGKNIEVTDAIRNVLEKKLSRMDKYFVITEDIVCRALIRSYKVGAKVEITIFTKFMDFRAEEHDIDLYTAVDRAIDSLERQMRKLKTRMSRRNKPDLNEAIAYENFEADPEENKGVVRTKSIFLEPMDLDEAIVRMEALGHKFFLYLDIEDNLLSVLYVRKDGGYGIIQAENKIQ